MAVRESTAASSSRVARARAHIDVTRGRGLEVGPLASPIVRKDEGEVYYVDVSDAQRLRDHYAEDPGVATDNVVDLDFVLFQEGVTRSLADVVGPAGPFQWVIASHVVEHVPDLIAFLADVASIMDDDGRLALAIPDRRYCFDALRPPTTVGEMLLAHDNRDSRPSVRAVFDHFADAVGFDPTQLWRGIPADPDNRMYPLSQAWDLVERRRHTNEYLDSHTWLFTPSSFVEQFKVLARLGLNDFTVIGLSPTAINDYEFFVTLRRLPRGLTDEQRSAEIDAGFPPVVENAETAREPATIARESATGALGDTQDGDQMLVSPRERRLIEAKRRLLTPLRRIVLRHRSR